MSSKERYERQELIPDWGSIGQAKLRDSHIGIAGTGGLGSPASIYLTAAGVGRITICDYQNIELSNLNRQVLYTNGDIGDSKVLAAARRLSAMNPDVEIQSRNEAITRDNVADCFSGCSLIVDCLDNMETRFLINEYCVENSIAFIHAGVREFYGQVMLIHPPSTACLACFLDAEGLENDGPIPICGSTAGVLGSLEANMAIQYLLGKGAENEGIFFSVDLTAMEINRIEMTKNPNCPVCGH